MRITLVCCANFRALYTDLGEMTAARTESKMTVGERFMHAYDFRRVAPHPRLCICAQVLAPGPGCIESLRCAVDNRQNPLFFVCRTAVRIWKARSTLVCIVGRHNESP